MCGKRRGEKSFWLHSHSPRVQLRRLAEGTQELTELGLEAPRYARRMLRQMERGEMSFIARLEGWEENMVELKQALNRVSVSVLTAALIVGLGLLMLIYHPPGWERIGGWFFGLLFGATVLFSAGLLWKILRSGRRM
jgi:hypothetical protein